MAKWSDIYVKHGSNGKEMAPHCSSRITVAVLLEEARFTPPSKPKKKVGGKYPHLQPFFKNRPKERLAA